MGLPSLKDLLGDRTGEDESDDVADALREMHGHLATGNYKGAAKAMRAAHRIIVSESKTHAGGDENDLYD